MKKKSHVNIAEFMRKYPYYEIPRFFLKARYKGLSANAKMAYAVLIYRTEQCFENGWINKGAKMNEIYINCYFNYERDRIKDALVEKLRSVERVERVRLKLKNGRISDVEAYIKSIFPPAKIKSFRDDIKCELDREFRRAANDLSGDLGISKLATLRAVEELVEFNLVSGAYEGPDGTAKKMSFCSDSYFQFLRGWILFCLEPLTPDFVLSRDTNSKKVYWPAF
jgi:hypothetical protein